MWGDGYTYVRRASPSHSKRIARHTGGDDYDDDDDDGDDDDDNDDDDDDGGDGDDDNDDDGDGDCFLCSRRRS